MDYLLEETVPAAELKKFESRYMSELDAEGKVAAGTQFEYAWCLVRSKYPADIRKGIALLEDLFQVRILVATCGVHYRGHENGPFRDMGIFPGIINPIQCMFQNRDESGKRDYLYYLAIGNARIKEYQTALKYVRALLQVQPGNRQAQDLEAVVTRRMEKDGIKGMAIVGGATLAFGALVGLGIAMAKKN